MKKYGPLLFPLLAVFLLILDSRCAAQSVSEGLELCLRTVIPALFPLFVLSSVLLPQLARVRFPAGFSRFLGIPGGCEGIFLLGCVGGFPLGARCIAQAVENSALSRRDGTRMLGLCSNCGPAFLFGILPSVFEQPLAPLGIFCIQLETALLTAALWPGKSDRRGSFSLPPVSLSDAVRGAVRSVGTVCAWILLASVPAGFLRRWLFPFLPQTLQLLCTGVLELTAGCLELSRCSDPGLRLVLGCGFVCFGGVSVLLQIRGVCPSLSLRPCVAQKLCQALSAMVLAAAVCRIGPAILLFPVPVLWFFKKQWHFRKTCGIIAFKREGSDHAVS